MEKYRVRRGLFGVCVLQSLSLNVGWIDVNYKKAPRALVSEFDAVDKVRALEIEVASLEAKDLLK